MLYDFDGGLIDIKYRVERGKLFVEYSLAGEDNYRSCIQGKSYDGFKIKGYLGVTAGNPLKQNVNDIDVHSIDFFNMNPEFY